MAAPLSLKWVHDGNWDSLMRGGATKASTCIVLKTEENVVHIQSHDGLIEIGDAVQNDIRYYSIIAVEQDGDLIRSFTLEIDGHFIPYRVNEQLIILKPKLPAEQDLTLETVLNQLGAYTYLVSYLFTNTVNLKDVFTIPPRFYYPTKHKNLPDFLKLIGQTLRSYWDFPDVVTGLDGFPVFIDQLVQISGIKMWQWVDKKLGYVTTIHEAEKRIKTRPVMQMPCGVTTGRNIFAIARKAQGPQSYYVAIDPPHPEDFYFGELIRFHTSAPSMDMWNLPIVPIKAKALILDVIGKRVRVRFQMGAFYKDDIICELSNPGLTYTITDVEKSGQTYSLYLTFAPPWAIGQVITKTGTGKRTNPLIQKATGIYLNYTYVKPIRLFVTGGELNWFSAQVANGTPEIGDIFHRKNDNTLYTITRINQNNFYCDPTPTLGFNNGEELELCRSTIDLACGITTPAYGEYYLSMTSTPLLYSNTTFRIVGRDFETQDLIYDEGENWSPAIINSNIFCTHYLYKKGDFCYNNALFPRTMEHLTQLLYEYQRLITAMWDQIQILGLSITNEMNDWITHAQNYLLTDPYWSLYYKEL